MNREITEQDFVRSPEPETIAKCVETSISMSPLESLLYGDRCVLAVNHNKAIPAKTIKMALEQANALDLAIHSNTIKLIKRQGKEAAQYSYLGCLGVTGTGLYPQTLRGKRIFLRHLKEMLKNGAKHDNVAPDGCWNKADKSVLQSVDEWSKIKN